MSESSDYASMRRNMPEPMDRLDRIENVLVPGMPDVNYCAEGVENWIEMKSPTEPKRPGTPLFGSNHQLSVDQKNWFLRHRNAGGRGWILVCTDVHLALIHARWADELNEMKMRDFAEVANFYAKKPMRKAQWKLVRLALIRD